MLELKQTSIFQKWERKLKDRRAKAIIAARLFRLANNLPGDVSPIGRGVSELRIHYGPGYRVYFKKQGKKLLFCFAEVVKALRAKTLKWHCD